MGKHIEQQIHQRTFIKAPREKVYATITSAEGWNSFFTNGMEIDLRPGGKIVFRWKDWGPDFYSVEAKGEVLRAAKPEQFVFQWYPVGDGIPTTIEMNLEESHGGTIVDLVEYGYPDTEKGRRMILECACGWGEALTLLKFYLEHGVTYTAPEK